jgi:hypothetical protein
MAASEQALTSQPSEPQENAAPSESEPQESNKGYRRRILHLVEETFGPSPHAQIQGLLALRSGEQVTKHVDEELRAAYARGRADLQAEIIFAERLADIRSKYPDFDRAWASVKPIVPRVIFSEVADHPEGLEAAYQLAKLPELCEELSALDPEKARERFRHFVKDLVVLTKGAVL